MAMGKTGGILMLVSLGLPVWMLYIDFQTMGYDIAVTMLFWLFGFYYITGLFSGISASAVGFIIIDIVSIVVLGLILIFSIIAIVKEGTTQMVMGLCALGVMAAYLLFYDLGFGFDLMWGGLGTTEFLLIPVGGSLCLIGAGLTIWGGAKTRM